MTTFKLKETIDLLNHVYYYFWDSLLYDEDFLTCRRALINHYIFCHENNILMVNEEYFKDTFSCQLKETFRKHPTEFNNIIGKMIDLILSVYYQHYVINYYSRYYSMIIPKKYFKSMNCIQYINTYKSLLKFEKINDKNYFIENSLDYKKKLKLLKKFYILSLDMYKFYLKNGKGEILFLDMFCSMFETLYESNPLSNEKSIE